MSAAGVGSKAMAFTQLDLDAINVAIKTGTVARIRFDNREVEYRSITELERIKAIIERDLALQNGGRRFSLAGFTRQS